MLNSVHFSFFRQIVCGTASIIDIASALLTERPEINPMLLQSTFVAKVTINIRNQLTIANLCHKPLIRDVCTIRMTSGGCSEICGLR